MSDKRLHQRFGSVPQRDSGDRPCDSREEFPGLFPGRDSPGEDCGGHGRDLEA